VLTAGLVVLGWGVLAVGIVLGKQALTAWNQRNERRFCP
jgi:hypothetical protein